jgi:hypothetical protein
MPSEPATSSDLVAIAIVVESSLVLLSEWIRVLSEYVSPLLKRLSETHVGHQFRIAFVTYATADTRPSPLLAKRFFMPLNPVTKELKDEPGKLGLGLTNCGGVQGMAALEGLVAAVELFDFLRLSTEARAKTHPLSKDSQQVSHIIHIAASPADSSEMPMWNDSPALDNVTWEMLPGELKKRNISYTMMHLRQLPIFPELHYSVAAGTTQMPWFNVRSPHTVLLAGIPASKSAKRPGDIQSSEKTLDTKRAKIHQPGAEASLGTSSSHNTPSQVPLTPPIPPQPLQQQQQQQQQPQQQQLVRPHSQVVTPMPEKAQLPTQSPSPQRLSASQQAMINGLRKHVHEIRQNELILKRLETAIAQTISKGNLELAEQLKMERIKQAENQERLKKIVSTALQTMQLGPAGQQAIMLQLANMPSGGGTPASGSTSAATQTPASQIKSSPQVPSSNTSTEIGAQGQALDSHQFPNRNNFPHQNLHPNQHAPPGAIGVPGPSRMAPTPQLAAQMQKLLEQRGNRPGPVLGQHPEHGQSSAPATAAQAQAPHSNNKVVWQGVLSWTGFDAATQGRKEVHAQVMASVQPGSERERWMLEFYRTRQLIAKFSEVMQKLGHQHLP